MHLSDKVISNEDHISLDISPKSPSGSSDRRKKTQLKSVDSGSKLSTISKGIGDDHSVSSERPSHLASPMQHYVVPTSHRPFAHPSEDEFVELTKVLEMLDFKTQILISLIITFTKSEFYNDKEYKILKDFQLILPIAIN